MYYNGWYQVAYERDLTRDINAVQIESIRLILVRTQDGVHAYDAFCPHRGAHLAMGGRIDDKTIICPFHGYRIGLNKPGDQEFCLREYRTLAVGGLVFVLLSHSNENGFIALMTSLDRDYYFVPGFAMQTKARAEMVIENAFDNTHFRPVHSIRNEPQFEIRPSQNGELAVGGTFEIPPSPWQKTRGGESMLEVPFVARAFSPNIVISEMGGENPYFVITAATPVVERECIIRLSLAVPPLDNGTAPSIELCQYLLRQSKAGIEKDQIIWENMSPTSRARYTPSDTSVIEFRKFCHRFRQEEHI